MDILAHSEDQISVRHDGIIVTLSHLDSGDLVIFAVKPKQYGEDEVVPMFVEAYPETREVVIKGNNFV